MLFQSKMAMLITFFHSQDLKLFCAYEQKNVRMGAKIPMVKFKPPIFWRAKATAY